jgi:AcrR family transcriptional regulator
MSIGRRERAKQDKRERIMAAARELLAQHGVSGVTIAADRR